MAATRIADIIVPEVFNPYVMERTAELASLWLGGIVSQSDELTSLAQNGGRVIQMPFWQDLTGDDEVLSDSTPLTVNKIDSEKDQAILFARGKAWGSNDLAKSLAGSDPMKAIGDLVAGYWNRMGQKTLLSILKGVIADNVAANSGDMRVSVASQTLAGISASTRIGSTPVIDAIGTLGDAFGKLTGIAMHSDCFRVLQKADVIVYEQASTADIQIPTYLGLRVIVDDSCPKVAGTTDATAYNYTSYLFGQGAIGWANGNAPEPTETDRDSLQGDDILITRRHFLLHPRGVAWTGATNAFPTNVTCEAAASWGRVYERKNVRLAALVTNV